MTGHGPAPRRAVMVDRVIPAPAERIWRALTEPHLMAEWLMSADGGPARDDAFRLTADWGSIDCRVIESEPPRRLAYSWRGLGMDTVVTWTLTPEGGGTRVRMEQAGFTDADRTALKGATANWPGMLAALERVATRHEEGIG